MHCQMEIRIVPFNSIQQLPDLNLRIKFLTDLTDKSILRTLPALDLTAGKFPPALEFAISPLGGEHLSIIDYYSCYNLYCLHIIQFTQNHLFSLQQIQTSFLSEDFLSYEMMNKDNVIHHMIKEQVVFISTLCFCTRYLRQIP